MITGGMSAGEALSEAVVQIGRITLHETAAYLAILALITVALAFASAHAARRRQREAWRAMRRLLGRHH
ncbi:hypothetical protein KGA66_04690 [Actinocrinis puniceicyclus]|uniref:Uncharacterized protein n=1 Tax=Actinocrinis puniceicyclus TaxID=977794 RepID=A0A8J8B9Y4_9ACTN|nr:hypothetical protein [Actinocrinis puniceicyclus]MBS2962332.1 hypothetical protein [Actinocrinis puniceicyclus]